MGFLRRLFGGGGTEGPADDATEPSTADGSGGARAPDGRVVDGDPTLARVVAWIRLADPSFESSREQQRLFALEDRLMRAVYDSGTGDLDTNELDRGHLALRFQGRDADAMVRVLVPLLGDVPPGSYLAIRRGAHGAPEDRLDLPVQPAAEV